MKATNKLMWRHSFGIFAGLVGYFFFMKLFGVEQYTQLRGFNFFIVLAGLYTVVKTNLKNNASNYFDNLFLAFRTAALSILMVLFSLWFYVQWIDASFINLMQNATIWGSHLSLNQILFALAVEGISSSFIISFIVMQYMKTRTSYTESMI